MKEIRMEAAFGSVKLPVALIKACGCRFSERPADPETG